MKEYRQQDDQRPNPRHRLVGALVLVALGVILVPLVLDFNAERGQATGGDVTLEKPRDFHVEEVPLITPGAVMSPPAAGDGTPAAADAAAAAPVVPAVPGVSGKPPAWVVQVGSFASVDNARALRDQLRSRGFKAVFLDRDTIGGKPAWRVRVGPEMERTRSEQVRDRLAQEMKLQGVVVSYDWRGARVE